MTNLETMKLKQSYTERYPLTRSVTFVGENGPVQVEIPKSLKEKITVGDGHDRHVATVLSELRAANPGISENDLAKAMEHIQNRQADKTNTFLSGNLG